MNTNQIYYGTYQYLTTGSTPTYTPIPTPLFWKVSDHKPRAQWIETTDLPSTTTTPNSPKISKINDNVYEMMVSTNDFGITESCPFTYIHVGNIYYSYETSSFQNNAYYVYFTKDVWITFILNYPQFFDDRSNIYYVKRGFITRDYTFPLTTMISTPELYNFDFTNNLSTLDFNLEESLPLIVYSNAIYSIIPNGVDTNGIQNLVEIDNSNFWLENSGTQLNGNLIPLYKYVLFKTSLTQTSINSSLGSINITMVVAPNKTTSDFFFKESDLSYLTNDVLEVLYLPFSFYELSLFNAGGFYYVYNVMNEPPSAWMNYICFNVNTLFMLSKINPFLSINLNSLYNSLGMNQNHYNRWNNEPYIMREAVKLYIVNASNSTFIDWMYFIPSLISINSNDLVWYLGFNENGVNLALNTSNVSNPYLQVQNNISPLNIAFNTPAISLTNAWTNYYSSNRQYYNASKFQANIQAKNAGINVNVVANNERSAMASSILHNIFTGYNPASYTSAIYTGLNATPIDSMASNSAKAAAVQADFMSQGIKTDLSAQTSLNNANSQIDSINRGSTAFQIFTLPLFYINQIWAQITRYGYLLNRYMPLNMLINRVNYNYIQLIDFTSSFLYNTSILGFSTSDMLYLEEIFTKGFWLWNNYLLLSNGPWTSDVIESNIEISNE